MLIGSCGRQNFPDYRDDQISYETFQGSYRAEFHSLNAKSVGLTTGHSILWARGTQFYARVNLQNHSPRVRHHQYIHQASKCPGRGADTNRDGIIDFAEVIAAAGKAIIPLDKKLSSRAEGFYYFPTSDDKGHYYYSESGHLGRMLEDLRGYPDQPNENFCRLEYNENLDLDNRIIMIYGNGEDDLFPIACAEINIDLHPED